MQFYSCSKHISPGDGNANHSSTLAWKIPWMEEPGGLQSIELDTTERLHFPFQTCFRCDYWTGQQRYKTFPSSVQKVLWDSAS